jgi:hypothetical protein
MRRILRPAPPLSGRESEGYPDFERSRFGKDDQPRLRPRATFNLDRFAQAIQIHMFE